MNKRLYFKAQPDTLIAYAKFDNFDLKLHVFNRNINGISPAIVFFHGGGWVDGSPKQFYRQCDYFLSRGMVAISAEYRIKSIHNSTPLDSVKDAKSAIRFIKKHADELKIDVTKLAVGGSSAGAHLAASLVTNLENNTTDDLTICPIPSLMILNVPVIDNSMEGFAYNRVKEYGDNFSPIDNLSPLVPKTLIFSAENDEKIDKKFSKRYIEILNTLNGGGNENILIAGASHTFNESELYFTVKKSDEFLQKHKFLDSECTLDNPPQRKKVVNMIENSTLSNNFDNLIPINSFLNRVFPTSFYEKDAEKIIKDKIFKPRKDCEDFSIAFPIDWEALDKKEDRNWRMQLQGLAMFHPIMNFFDEYLDKETIVKYFFEVVEDWDKNYGEDPDNIVTSRMPESYAWYDMSVGFRALVLAFFINRIEEFSLSVTEQNKNLLQKVALKHIQHLKNPEVFSLNNHGMFQIQGLMALIQLQGIQNYKKVYTYCLDKMEELILAQYNKQGIHQEHSPHYHFYALTTFENLLENDWYDEKPIIKEIVKKAQSIKKWIVDPYKRPACIGDSIMTAQKSVDFNKHDFADELENSTEDRKFVYSNFNDSGYTVFRSAWDTKPEECTYLFFMGMYNDKTHKHRDCQSFEWFDSGKKILCDGGKYGYKSDKYRNYFLSYKAHNTVEIEGFDILKIKPYISSIKSTSYSNGVFYLNSALEYPAINHQRELYVKSKCWLIVNDTLKFAKARKATQWFHLEKEFKLKSFKNGYGQFCRNNDELIVHCLDKDINSSLYYGDDEIMQGFISENDFLYEKALALGFELHGEHKNLITIFALSKEAYFDALAYLSSQNMYKTDIDENVQLPQTPLIKNIKHLSSIDPCIEFKEEKYTYSTYVNNMKFDFYFHNKKSEKVLIMLPGAIDRTKIIYNFQRFSWSDEFDYSVMSILDPTINESNDLSIGWFQGTSNNFAIETLAALLKNLFEKNNINEKNVSFFGSSAGGFTSLMLANSFPKSKIIVINPQTCIQNYHEKEFQKILDYCYSHMQKSDVIERYKNRLEVNIDFSLREAPIYYLQNKADIHHMKKHLDVLLEKVEDKNFVLVEEGEILHDERNLNVLFYTDPESGHSPPSKEKTIQIINGVINNQYKGKPWDY